MRSIATIAQKGGVGKTTQVTNLAAFAASLGKRVFIIEMDPQGSATRWCEERSHQQPDLPAIRVDTAFTAKQVQVALAAARSESADFVFIDTPQGTGDEHFAAIAGAHLVLIPSKPYLFDVNSIVRTIKRSRLEGRDAYVVFNEVEPGAEGKKHVAGAIEGLILHAKATGEPPPQICKKFITHRVEFPLAAARGLGVVESAPSSAAAKDTKALAEWAFDLVAKAPAKAQPQLPLSRRRDTP